MFIDDKEYAEIIQKMPILCVDVILRFKDQVLLVKRENEPCKGIYWPIGGRVHISETAVDAARRKIFEEIGIEYKRDLIPIGYYEDTYTESAFAKDTVYHSLSLVFVGDLAKEQKQLKIKLDRYHSDFGYFDTLPQRFKVKRFSDFEEALQEWT